MLSRGSRPPRRGHALCGTAVIDRRHQHEPQPGGALGIFAQPADVSAVPGRPDGDPQRPSLGDYQVQQPVRLDLPQAPLTVANHQRRRLLQDLESHARAVFATLDELDILGKPHHPVRIVTPQVRPDQAACHHQRLVGRNTGGSQQVAGKPRQHRALIVRKGGLPILWAVTRRRFALVREGRLPT